MTNYGQQLIELSLKNWDGHVKRAHDFFSKLSDEQLELEVAPGRNRALYLMGHLIASNDYLLPLLGLGERLYPELEAYFIRIPDKTKTDYPLAAELREKWEYLHARLAERFATLTIEDWLSRHTSVSEEDFAINPTRNKLNVLLSRTSHISYHLGQLALVQV